MYNNPEVIRMLGSQFAAVSRGYRPSGGQAFDTHAIKACVTYVIPS